MELWVIGQSDTHSLQAKNKKAFSFGNCFMFFFQGYFVEICWMVKKRVL